MPPKPIITPAYSSNVELYSDLDSAGLTPRTPFSRKTAQLEEGRAGSRSKPKAKAAIPVNEPISENENEEEFDDIDLSQEPNYPLLQESIPMLSSRDDTTSGQWRKPTGWAGGALDVRKLAAQVQRIPLGLMLGCGTAVLLIFLIFASMKQNSALLDYMGINTTLIKLQTLDNESKNRFNTSTVIDYSNYSSFPLTTDQYLTECWKVVRDARMKPYVPYWDTHPGAELDVLHQKSTSIPPTCSSTITYILDGSVGLMADLAHIAIISAFARERNRTFFIYDKNWNRGRWADHFLLFSETQPGPEPGCTPPPSDEMVSCPRTARHWVTSARINFVHFSSGFEDEFEDPFKSTIERKKPLYSRSTESLSKFIQPSKLNQDLIQNARWEVSQLALQMNNSLTHYISAHIRRGDRHAMSWRYNFMPARHVPTQEYVDAAWKTYSWLTESSTKPSHPLFIYLASDSTGASTEFINTLTSNNTLVRTFNDENLYPFVYTLKTSLNEELRGLAPSREYVQSEWNDRTETDRIRETRGVIVDWALISGAWQNAEVNINQSSLVLPQATICTLPSNLCKLAVSALGWDYAFDWQVDKVGPHPRWVEIDNGGSILPIWTPFEIFS